MGEDEGEGYDAGMGYERRGKLSILCQLHASIVDLTFFEGEQALEPDHGFPLRLVVPGQIGGESCTFLRLRLLFPRS